MNATAVIEPEKGDNDEPPLPSHGHPAPNPSVPETTLPSPMERELPHLQEQQNSLSTSTDSGHQGVIATCNSVRPCTESQSQYATLGPSKSPTSEPAIDNLRGQIPSDYIALSESTEMDSEEMEAMNKVHKWRNQIVELSESEDEDEDENQDENQDEQEGKEEKERNETETVSKGLSGRTYIFSSDLVSVSAATETSSLQHRRQQYIAYQNRIRQSRENQGQEKEEGQEREARNHKKIKNWIIDHKSSFVERIKHGFSFGEKRKRKRKAASVSGAGAGGVGINRELTPLRNWDPMLGTKRLPPKPELTEEEKEERQINKMRRSGNYLQ